MRKKNNKSTKIAVISTVIVIALVGISVFSLYSLAEKKNDEGLKLAASCKTEAGASTNTSKLLSRIEGESEAYVEAQPVVEKPAVKVDEPAPAVVQTETKKLVVVDNVVDTEASYVPVYSEPVYEEPVYEEPVYEEPVYEEPVYDETVSDDDYTDYVQFEPVSEEPLFQVAVVEEPVYEYSDEAALMDDQSSYEENTGDGEWIYNYDTDEWEYVSNQTPSADTSYDAGNDYSSDESAGSSESTGEWVFNYNTEEWEYVENGQTPSVDTSYDAGSDYSSDESAGSSESTGEWIYNYDTDEWEYVTDQSSSGDTSYDDTSYDDTSDDSSSDTSYDDTDYSEEEVYVPSDAYLGQQIVDYASQWVGVTPYVEAAYRWTGSYYYNSLTEGTDCSGFTHLIYGAFGIYLPTGSDVYQYGVGTQISYDQLLPGDIVVYRYGGHVAIYAGNDTIIHCSTPSNGTIYSTMWYSTPTAYLRVVY